MTNELEPCYSCEKSVRIPGLFDDITVICQCPEKKKGVCDCPEARRMIHKIGGI